MPPTWSPPAQVEKLPQDNGEYLLDRNAAKYPAHPIEAAVLAAMMESPEECGSGAVDIFACSSSLGNLLRFIRGEEKPFRILVEKVGNTVFFTRRERSPTEKIPDVKGFGHTFPEAYTRWDRDVKSSTSHQRVLRYSLGGLQCIVRFEADGFIPGDEDKVEECTAQLDVREPSSLSTAASLVTAFGEVDVRDESVPIETSKDGLTFKQAGRHVPQRQIFDLKTRAEWKKDQDTMAQELPRMWLTQLDKFIMAYHKDGLFNDVEIHNVRDKVLQWERSNTEAIAGLLSLIRRIISTAERVEEGKFEVCHMKDRVGTLQFRRQLPEAGSALSPETQDKWLAVNEIDQEQDDSDSDGSSIGGVEWDSGGADYTDCSTVCGYCGQCAAGKTN